MLQSISQQIATSLQLNRVQSSLLLKMIVADNVGIYRFVVEQKSVIFSRLVLN